VVAENLLARDIFARQKILGTAWRDQFLGFSIDSFPYRADALPDNTTSCRSSDIHVIFSTHAGLRVASCRLRLNLEAEIDSPRIEKA
jgi:hypothetical protein